MAGEKGWSTFLAHAFLMLGVGITVFPMWLVFVASTQSSDVFLSGQLSLLPGTEAYNNYRKVLFEGAASTQSMPIWRVMQNSLVMAILIAVGKIVISIISAFAIVYFRFPLRNLIFLTIFLTLMLPVEVRIFPTLDIVAGFGLLNTWTGLTMPLIASATATFLFRQFFMTVPDELTEAAMIDGATPMRFFRSILLPLSRTNIAALFVILFIYGWNQYLWPLLVAKDESFATVLTVIKQLVTSSDNEPRYNLLMAVTVLAALPPVAVILMMQRLFIKGLVEVEK
jgi:sn-glycerol 3-phosphate transport system permease protein